jgi:high-affinity iron transporter
MPAILLIVFREILEAGLIVGIVLAATRGVPRRGLWVGYGVAGGALGACVVAGFAGEIASWFEGSGQELFNASVLGLAVCMLIWHNVWMASHGRAMAQSMRELGAAVVAGKKPLAALAIVCGMAVLREGSEIVLFIYSIVSSGGASPLDTVIGGGLGVLAGAAISAFMYLGLSVIPARHIFSVTSVLITLLAAGLAAQAVNFIQQAGFFEVMVTPVWDISWLLAEDSLFGRLLHVLIGYTDRPAGAQLVVYLATIVVTVTLMRLVRLQTSRRQALAAQ